MQTEIEVKFLDTNHDEVRQKLTELGGQLVTPMRDMRRALIETEAMAGRHGFIRLRHEGDKVTLTYKQFDKQSIDGAKEIEVTVSDFDATLAIFAQADLYPLTYQESRRETWKLGEVEVVLDEWPWIAPYIEIEASSEELVRETAGRLGFTWDDAVFGTVDVIYEATYPKMNIRGVIDLKEAKFGDPVPPQFLGEAAK